jgi:hypothetical protein
MRFAADEECVSQTARRRPPVARIEAHAATIPRLLESKRDITLVEIKQALAERELAFSVTTT